MDEVNSKVIRSIFLFVVVFTAGVLGYQIIEGWNLLDAIYMTIITLGTIGYGETHELSKSGRIFTIFLIIGGLGSAVTVLNSFASVLIDNKLNHFLGRKAMNSEIKRVSNHVILCGLGQLGSVIALKLQEKRVPVIVVESNPEELYKIKQLGLLSVEGEMTSDATLLSAGVQRAKTLVICIPDATLNLTISLAAKELNPEIEVIAYGTDRKLESRIKRAGADTIVYPLDLGAEQISEKIAGDGSDSVSVGHHTHVEGYYLKLYKHFESRSISVREILERETGIKAIELITNEKGRLQNPGEDSKLERGEGLIILMKKRAEDLETPMMKYPKIIWTEDYSVGISSIDEEHMELIRLINHFNEALSEGSEKSILASTFDRLIAYSLVHFKNEEAMMREHQYEGLEAHIREHETLMRTVLDLNLEKNYIFSATVMDFLNMWLIEHIQKCDFEYKGKW